MRLSPAAADVPAQLAAPRPAQPAATSKPERGEESRAALPAPAIERYFSSREVDERAEPVNQVDLEYPAEALARNVSGAVKLRLLIDKGGTVREAKVLESEPQGVFDEAALRAIRGLRFQPAIRNGVAVGSVKTIEVPFYPNCHRTGSCAN